MEHIPGPWEAHENCLITAGKNKMHIAQCATTGLGYAAAGNARLIAAAPEMLRALELALIDIENTLRRTFNTDPQTDTTYTIIRNTIRKATGE